MIYLMVVAGGITRLTGSGLSITQWQIVTGTLPPRSEKTWQTEFDSYKQTPQFKLLNSNFEMSDFKKIYWWEYIHRLIGRITGIIFLIPFFWFWLKKKFPSAGGFKKKVLIIFFLGAFQGALGWFMVKSGLSENVHVSHYRLAAHLITAFATFGFTFWLAMDLIFNDPPASALFKEMEARGDVKKFSIILFSVITLQIIYGAFVSGLKAGYGYPTWPKMGNAWIPDDIFALEPVWKNFFEGHAGVQFVHRYLAYAVVIIAGILFWYSKKTNISIQQKKNINLLVIIVLAQFALGVITILYGVPIIIAILHQTGAFFLFATTLLLIHSTK